MTPGAGVRRTPLESRLGVVTGASAERRKQITCDASTVAESGGGKRASDSSTGSLRPDLRNDGADRTMSQLTSKQIYEALGRSLCERSRDGSASIKQVRDLVRASARHAEIADEEERVNKALRSLARSMHGVTSLFSGVKAWVRLWTALKAIQPAEYFDEGAGI